jgi:nitrous oxidase accessory protein NosD
MAGGPNRAADPGREYIIRADGEVVSRKRGETIWSGSEFSNLRIYPGDTIMVPEKTYKPSMMNSVMNWSQLASQLAMDSAMISVLK